VRALLDTNILVDCLYRVDAAVEELGRYEHVAVSRIVWIEFLVGAKAADIESRRRSLLDDFQLIEIDQAISEETALIRRRTRLKLADALILATARVHGLLLVTRNARDFSRNDPDVRIPY
jgi:predicted nucleic acid-binding protein